MAAPCQHQLVSQKQHFERQKKEGLVLALLGIALPENQFLTARMFFGARAWLSSSSSVSSTTSGSP